MNQAVVKAVENVVREAALLVRDADQCRQDAERLLRQLREGVLVRNVGYFPDLRMLGAKLLESSVRADTIMRMELDKEEA